MASRRMPPRIRRNNTRPDAWTRHLAVQLLVADLYIAASATKKINRDKAAGETCSNYRDDRNSFRWDLVLVLLASAGRVVTATHATDVYDGRTIDYACAIDTGIKLRVIWKQTSATLIKDFPGEYNTVAACTGRVVAKAYTTRVWLSRSVGNAVTVQTAGSVTVAYATLIKLLPRTAFAHVV